MSELPSSVGLKPNTSTQHQSVALSKQPHPSTNHTHGLLVGIRVSVLLVSRHSSGMEWFYLRGGQRSRRFPSAPLIARRATCSSVRPDGAAALAEGGKL